MMDSEHISVPITCNAKNLNPIIVIASGNENSVPITCNAKNLNPKIVIASGNENNDWIIEISSEEGIKFNREAFPNSQPQDFADAFIKILEMNYQLKFEKKEPPYDRL